MVTVFYALMHAAADEVTSGRLDIQAADSLVGGSTLGAFRPHDRTHTNMT
jgi:hypothetical protein